MNLYKVILFFSWKIKNFEPFCLIEKFMQKWWKMLLLPQKQENSEYFHGLWPNTGLGTKLYFSFLKKFVLSLFPTVAFMQSHNLATNLSFSLNSSKYHCKCFLSLSITFDFEKYLKFSNFIVFCIIFLTKNATPAIKTRKFWIFS